MTTANDAFTSFAGLQKEALEPLRAANSFAADAFERMTRQTYAVIGDYVNFAVEQARLPVATSDYNEYLARQMEHTRRFGEQLARRSQEYLEMLSAFQAKAQSTAQATVQAAVPTAATKKAA